MGASMSQSRMKPSESGLPFWPSVSSVSSAPSTRAHNSDLNWSFIIVEYQKAYSVVTRAASCVDLLREVIQGFRQADSDSARRICAKASSNTAHRRPVRVQESSQEP